LGGSPLEWDPEFVERQQWKIKRCKPNPWKLPWFWSVPPHFYGFGFWSSGPESLYKDGLLTYHNLQGRSDEEREADLVELQSSNLRALLHWIKIRCSLGKVNE